MSRPLKTNGISYFPVEIQWKKKIKLFKAKYKLEGIGFLVTLWQNIYTEGYYIVWDEETKLLFSDENNIDINEIDNKIEFAIKKKIFNEEKYNKYNILTSSAILKRYLNACSRRTMIELNKKFITIDINEIIDYTKGKNVSIKWVNE